ncbi:MAG: transglycosylase domain-containing protein [Candidatus Limnocylindrales bacterium]
MSYRPLGARPRTTDRVARINPTLRRAALMRAAAAGRNGKQSSSRMPLVFAILGLAIVTVLTTAGAVVGGATVTTISLLESDLPDPTQLERLNFPEPTVIYDRTGTTELARFQEQRRKVVGFGDIPPLLIDATTAAEDRTFWQNEGFDPAAIGDAVLENISGESNRGASTITQQLVRARLLPQEYLEPGADPYVRKAKELLQASRVTQAFPGESGKRRIITAYLNEIYYGHKAYGVAAAAEVYFGASLDELSPSQAALLAALPKSPSTLDPYRYAEKDEVGRLVVPQNSPPIVRRDYVLRGMTDGRWVDLDKKELAEALREPMILVGEKPLIFKAPHFVWQVKQELDALVSDRDSVETGGYRVITSLDMKTQQLAERYITAGAILPNTPAEHMEAQIARRGLDEDAAWIRNLRGRDLHNGAMTAVDYRTGEVLAYVGSAGYYRSDLESEKFDPKYDVAGVGFRQPGSAFKPVVYSTGFATKAITPGSLLLDITTAFGKDSRTGKVWTPRDADRKERGPVTVRKALQYSLNIPAIRAMQKIGPPAVAKQSTALGIEFQGGPTALEQAGLAGAIGTVEVQVLDLTAAYGALANGGKLAPTRKILEVQTTDGSTVYRAGRPNPVQALNAGAADLITDVLKGNTDPRENLIWGPMFQLKNGPKGERRPMALKTGTTNDTRDLSTYGYLAPPADPNAPALAVGVWMGNSDHSQPRGEENTFASDAPGRVWHAFVREMTNGKPVAAFEPHSRLVQADIDKWSGGAPGSWTRETREEWFLPGTEPGASSAVDQPGLLYGISCGQYKVDPIKAEQGPEDWRADVANWTARARGGTGAMGEYDTTTDYFWGESSWCGSIVSSCRPIVRPPVSRGGGGRPQPTARPGGGGGGQPTPKPEPTPKPKPTPKPEPTPKPGGGGGAQPTPTP